MRFDLIVEWNLDSALLYRYKETVVVHWASLRTSAEKTPPSKMSFVIVFAKSLPVSFPPQRIYFAPYAHESNCVTGPFVLDDIEIVEQTIKFKLGYRMALVAQPDVPTNFAF